MDDSMKLNIFNLCNTGRNHGRMYGCSRSCRCDRSRQRSHHV